MNSELRFITAIGLMIAVLVGTNILFPPVEPEPLPGADSTAVQVDTPSAFGDVDSAATPATDALPGSDGAAPQSAVDAADGETPPAVAPEVPRRTVVVESPLYRHEFDNYGGAITSAELLTYASFATDAEEEDRPPVELVPEGARAMNRRMVVGQDTLDLDRLAFQVEPAEGLQLASGDAPATLTFRYESPNGAFGIELAYTFDPDDYEIAVQTRVRGIDRPLLLTSLGNGMAFAEADSAQEARAMAWVGNFVNEGIDSEPFDDIEERGLIEGPLHWTAYRNRYFVTALHAGTGAEGEESFLGGLLVTPLEGAVRGRVEATQSIGISGVAASRIYMGPQTYSRLQAFGHDFEEVNPYGWRWLRPLLRPIVGGILWLFTFLHDTLNIGYGWVLVLFGVMMRILLWPLNQKAMRAQFRNMAVQPLLKEIQTKYKDQPEKLQKEMMKLYKEHGFNPLAGCLPLFIPWPVLIALFFVFQNTIELRGVPFMWLPDLSAHDPLYILPIILAVSMFLLQWISFRSMPEANPQMKTMMWVMPPVFGFIFMQFPSGLNLYYAVSNIATLPQQVLIANERKKHAEKEPLKSTTSGGSDDAGSGGRRKKRR